VKAWIDGQLVALQKSAELPVVENADLSPARVIVLSTRALAGDAPVPPQVAWVGPALTDRPDATPFPWDDLPPAPRVLVSLGTVSGERGAAFYQAVVDGISRSAGVILVAPPELVPDPPANVLVRARVPQLALLSHVQAVVTHAGHNTVCEALAHGLPLVCAPIRDDQPVIAGQVQAAGAGLRVRFAHPSAGALRDAVTRVLTEAPFRESAQRIQQSFVEAGGAARAAELVEAVS
jgi:MGT family glycosyltransferase